MFTAALSGNVRFFGADSIENIFSLLLLQFVYRAVAQQRVDHIRYNAIYRQTTECSKSLESEATESSRENLTLRAAN
jgi:hypothetical protein